MAAYLI
ncbi:bd84d2c8-36d9-46fd-bcca-2c7c2d05b80c [Thermothielavioides terrestris]|nr:bd84d2c8-36d9-46fd-bcca-2c7c2d05b80c [Thermothielavioides terrestris]